MSTNTSRIENLQQLALERARNTQECAAQAMQGYLTALLDQAGLVTLLQGQVTTLEDLAECHVREIDGLRNDVQKAEKAYEGERQRVLELLNTNRDLVVERDQRTVQSNADLGRINEQGVRIATLQTAFDQQSEQIVELHQKISELEGRGQDDEGRIHELEAEAEQLRAQIAELEHENGDLTSAIGARDETITDLREERAVAGLGPALLLSEPPSDPGNHHDAPTPGPGSVALDPPHQLATRRNGPGPPSSGPGPLRA